MPLIQLPGDERAFMADPDEMTGLEVEQAASLLDLGDLEISEKMAAAQLLKVIMRMAPMLNRALTVAMVREWTLTGPDDEPLPVTMDTVGGLPYATLRPLYDHAIGARPILLEALGLGALGPGPKSEPGS